MAAIAADATSAYWTTGFGAVMRFDGQACQSGLCKCPGAEVVCSGTCIDTSTDSANCGTCGTACSGGTTCQKGACECPGTQKVCFGLCTDTSSDSTNCGTCGINCASGMTCQGGSCK